MSDLFAEDDAVSPDELPGLDMSAESVRHIGHEVIYYAEHEYISRVCVSNTHDECDEIIVHLWTYIERLVASYRTVCIVRSTSRVEQVKVYMSHLTKIIR